MNQIKRHFTNFQVSLINFAITFSGLEDQLLGVVVVEEMPEMEEKKNSLVVSNARMRRELQELEDTILYMLSNSTGNILDDHKLIETLASSKIKSAPTGGLTTGVGVGVTTLPPPPPAIGVPALPPPPPQDVKVISTARLTKYLK